MKNRCVVCHKKTEEKKTCSWECAGKLASSTACANKKREVFLQSVEKNRLNNKLIQLNELAMNTLFYSQGEFPIGDEKSYEDSVFTKSVISSYQKYRDFWKWVEEREDSNPDMGVKKENLTILNLTGAGIFEDILLHTHVNMNDFERGLGHTPSEETSLIDVIYSVDCDEELFPWMRKREIESGGKIHSYCGKWSSLIDELSKNGGPKFDIVYYDACGTWLEDRRMDIEKIMKYQGNYNYHLAITLNRSRENQNSGVRVDFKNTVRHQVIDLYNSIRKDFRRTIPNTKTSEYLEEQTYFSEYVSGKNRMQTWCFPLSSSLKMYPQNGSYLNIGSTDDYYESNSYLFKNKNETKKDNNNPVVGNSGASRQRLAQFA